MKIGIVGSGLVGFATGRGFERFGYNVTFYDINPSVRERLKQEGHRVSEKFPDADIVFICTPESAVEEIVEAIRHFKGLLVIRSTVMPGTTQRLSEQMQVHLCCNPEFLREGVASWDFMRPHKIVLGCCCKEHAELLETLYKPFNAPIIKVTPTEAEITKLVSNAHLATLISFWNEISSICERCGVNSHLIGKIVSMDPRISDYGAVQHGEAYGGFCLPKDLEHLMVFAFMTFRLFVTYLFSFFNAI